MNWVTVAWTTIAAACLTLGAIHLPIWCRDRRSWPNLAFSITAVMAAAVAWIELLMLRAGTHGEYGLLLRLLHVPAFINVVAMVFFVRSYLGAGRVWLGLAAIGVRAVSLFANFLTGENLNFREVTSLRMVDFLGDVVAVPVGVVNPWMAAGSLSLILLAAYLVDATFTVWRRGERQRALLVGASMALFVLLTGVQSFLFVRGMSWLPFFLGPYFMGMVIALGYELSRDLLRGNALARQLEASEERLRACIQNTANVAVQWYDEEGRVQFWNQASESLFGWSAKEAMGRTLDQLIQTPEQAAAFRAALRGIKATNQPVGPVEYRYKRRDGTPCACISTHFLIPGPNGATWFACMDVDVTERTLAEKALRDSEELHRVTLTNISDTVLIATDDGTLKYVCPNVDAIFGCSSEEVAAQGSVERLLGSGLFDFAKLDEMGELRNIERLITTPRSGQRVLLVNVKRVSIAGGTVLYTCRDISERKHVEDELRASEERFHKFMNQSPVVAWIKDDEFKFRYVNSAFEKLFQRTSDEILGKTDYDIYPREFANQTRTNDFAVLESGELLEADETVPGADGAMRHWLVQKFPIRGTARKPWLGGTAVNVTERRTAEQALRSLVQGTSSVGGDFFVSLVRELASVLGVRYALVGRLLPGPEHRVRTIAAWADGVLAQNMEYDLAGSPCANVVRQRLSEHPSGVRELFPDDRMLVDMGAESYMGTPLFASDGSPLGLVAILDDKPMEKVETAQSLLQIFASRAGAEIERMETEGALRASETNFRGIFDNLVVGSVQLDADARFIRVNDRFCTITGYSREELINGMGPLSITHPDDIDADRGRIARLISGEEDYSAEKRYLRKDGTVVWVRVSASILRDEAGLFRSTAAIVEDVTQRRQLEEQLRQSQKMDAIGQLAGGVAHDFNNMLGAIMMQADVVSGLQGMPPLAIEGLQEIHNAADRAAALTRQLLLFSRRQVMQLRDLDLNTAVTGLARMLQRVIGAEIRMQLNLHPASLPIRADASMLDQVLLNLTVNARDAMPSGGRLLIETAALTVDARNAAMHPEIPPGTYAWLSVSDTGSGIPPEVLPHIFEPFFTTKEPGTGTGLGLATVFGIVKQHNGWLKIASEVGVGTKAQIFLPASATKPQEVPPPGQKTPPPRGSETILLVEDDAGMRSSTRLVLELSGYRVLEATNGADALVVWQAHREEIAVLLTDLIMPGAVSGQNLAQQLKSENPSLNVLFISGYSAELAGRELSLKSGENFLQKPFTGRQMLEVIRRALDGPK